VQGSEQGHAGQEHWRCGYYLRQPHNLIRRHSESLNVNPDHTAEWRLKIDFELPTEPIANWGTTDAGLFLFPIVYLRKTDARTCFEIRDENGSTLVPPIRTECDRISAAAAASAVNSLAPSGEKELPLSELEEVLHEIPSQLPVPASIALRELRIQVGMEDESGKALSSEVGDAWREAGLEEVLNMLVEHSLVWLPIRGRPGERRSIELCQQISLERRALLRWAIGSPKPPKHWWQFFKRSRMKKLRTGDPADLKDLLLLVGKTRYCRRARRVSFSALGERIAQPLAWMPFEFEFPTIYTKRCASYHLEVVCPQGRSPRDLRPAKGTPLAEPSGTVKAEEPPEGRTTLTSKIAHHYMPGNADRDDIWFRVTIGVGDGAFPGLWFLTAAITAGLLWALAGTDPDLTESNAQIVAAVLLIAPALIAALAVGSNEIPLTRLMGGARVLLMVTGLSAVAAAAILALAEPLQIERSSAWMICAIAATAAAVPLAASWLLSSPLVWGWLMYLSSPLSQKRSLRIGIGLALIPIAVLLAIRDQPAVTIRILIAVYLLVLAIAMSVVASNRAATKIGQTRRYVAVSFLGAAIACLALACVELGTAIADPQHIKDGKEVGTSLFVFGIGALILLRSPLFGERVSWVTKRFAPKEDEVHVSPRDGRALLAEESVRELIILRRREREAASNEADH
jgi:hypothetical protein